MAKSSKSAFVVLKDKDGNRATGVRLLELEDGQLGYSWDYAPAIAPTVLPADVSYGAYSSDQEITWSQNNWSGGGLKLMYEPDRPNEYALADKVWTSTKNEISLAPQPLPLSFGIPNGTAELGENTTSAWTVSSSSVTLSVVSTDPYSGTYHFQMAGASNNDYIHKVIENPTRWRGAGLYVIAKVKSTVAGGTVRMSVIEAGGAGPTTNGSTVTLTTSYQTMFVSVATIDASVTSITVRITCLTGDEKTIYVDQIQALVSNQGMNSNGLRMVSLGTDLYATMQRGLYKFVEATLHWELIYASTVDITGIEMFDNRIYLALGASTPYVYSDAGDTTTWTAAPSDFNAIYFGKIQDRNGDNRLARTADEDKLEISIEPTGSDPAPPVWGSAVDIGKNDRTITNIHNVNGNFAVGKEDGLYIFSHQNGIIVQNKLTNEFPYAESAVDTNNFSRGISYNGWFYTVFSEVGLIRYNGSSWEEMSRIIQSPGLADVGNRVRAFGTDGTALFILVEDLSAASETKKSYLYALYENRDGTWAVHIIASMTITDANDMFVFKPSGATNRHLFINGLNATLEAVTYRLLMPDRTDTPRLATNRKLALSGTFITSYWDGNRPQVTKSFNKITLISESLSSTQTVSVAYQIDNNTTWTDIHVDNSTFNSSPSGTIGFNEGVFGKRIRLRFTLATTSVTASPVIRGFALHMSWRPPRVKRWRIMGAIEDDMRLLQGVRHPLTPKRMLTNLRSLAEDASPIAIEDIDGDTHRAHIVELAETQFKVRSDTAGTARYSRAVNITLVETPGGGWGFVRWGQFYWE